jgi:hypothetical protein
MKFINICAIILVCATSASSTLLQDYEALRSLILWQEFKVIVSDYIKNDPETAAAIVQLKSDDFDTCYTKFIRTKEVTDFLNYLQGSGIKAVNTLNQIASYLGLPAFVPKKFNCEMKQKIRLAYYFQLIFIYFQLFQKQLRLVWRLLCQVCFNNFQKKNKFHPKLSSNSKTPENSFRWYDERSCCSIFSCCHYR